MSLLGFASPQARPRRPVHAAQGRKHRHLLRWTWLLATSSIVAIGALWWGVTHTTWLGPGIANGLRSVFGTNAVESLERFVATVRDQAKQALPPSPTTGGYEEQAFVSDDVATASPDSTSDAVPEVPFRPANVGPMDARVALPGDGVWRPIHDGSLDENPLVYATLLHPDPQRPWSKLFAFAMDLRHLDVHAVPGTEEPKSTLPTPASLRTGLIPRQDHARLVVALNGGFKAEHGRHGMHVSGTTLLPAREGMCTIAGYEDGTVRIGTWAKLAPSEGSAKWWRQTPPCMVEAGTLHRGLLVDANTNWGAALGGDVVIPRSALGLDQAGTTLYFSLSHDATPRIIAKGMQHVGASDIAQLDVNWPYPRLLLFRHDEAGELIAVGVVKDVPFHPDDYLRKPSRRDFFYITQKERDVR